MIKNYTLALILFVCIINNAFAQVPTNGDCLGAIPVCQSVYSFGSSANGAGAYTDLPYQGPASNNYCPGNCISSGESNSTWYIFTTQNAGNISFVIDPVDDNDDYDWALYNITTNDCSNIFAGGMQVSCNYCLNTGNTGPNQANADYCEGPSGCSSFNKIIPSPAGSTYALMVNNFSGSFNGYSLDFSASTAGVVDNSPPFMSAIQTPVICGANNLVITFNENIRCNSITGSDFTLTGPGGPYTISYVSGSACNAGGTFENIYTLTVMPDMATGGTYTLWLSGAVLDNCGNASNPADARNTKTFTITPVTTTLSSSPATVCPGSSVTLTAGGATTYQWSHGLGTGNPKVVTPGATTTYSVAGTTGGCSSSATVTVNITPTPAGNVFANPINLGTLTCQNYSDIKNNSTTNCFGNEYGHTSDDIYYSFTLATAATIEISLCGTGFDTYMYLLNSGGGLITSNDDSGPLCAGLASSMRSSLAAGTYYIVVEGYSSNAGNINTQISFPSPAGSITASTAAVCEGGPVTYTATTTSAYGTFSMFQYQWDGTGGAWNDWATTNPYIWTSGWGGHTLYVRGVFVNGPCTAYSNIVSTVVASPTAGAITGVPATICDGSNVTYTLTGYPGTFNLFQYQWDGTAGAWTDWGTTNPYVWTAGWPGHTLYVRGVVTNAPCGTAYSAPVAVTITAIPVGATISNPIAVGTLGCTSYSNIQNNNSTNCFGHQFGQACDDIYYSFSLSSSTIVNISHCGSGFDTYMYLLNSGGGIIQNNDDGGPICGTYNEASMQTTLAAGTYYVVSEGYGTNSGNINTQFSVPVPSGGTIAGNSFLCYGSNSVSYSISGVTAATAYNWTVPAGAGIASGQGTANITVNWGTAASGNITCTPSNGPCTGTTVSSAVTVVPGNNWIGVTSTDWFTASNWCLGGIIPQITTDVIIPNAIITPNDPNINAVGAVCRNMTMQAGSITNITGTNPLNVYGNWSDAGVFNEASGVVNFVGTVAQQINTAETFYQLNINNTTGVTITSPNTVSNRLILTSGALTHGANLTIANNATIERFTGSLASAPVFGAGVNLIYRSAVNSGYEIPVAASVLRNMELNTPAAGIVTLTTPATLNAQLTFTSGVLRTTATNILTFADNSIYTGASNSCFVDGPVSKIGDDAFEFPTGDIVGATWVWAPLAIADPGAVTTDRFTTTYYFTYAPNNWGVPNMCNPLVLDHASGIEYWDIQRVSGSTYPNVTLFWKDANRSGISSLSGLTTAHYEVCSGPNKWVDKGGTGTGTVGVGGIGQITGSGFTSYSPVTFAALKGSPNSLPVNLLEFYATCVDRIVHLTWSTASETNNDYFTIERSPDMNLWDQLAMIDGAGNSNELKTYEYADESPYEGTSYYRLKQTDYNGAFEIFTPLAVACISPGSEPNVIFYPNPFDGSIVAQLNNVSDETMHILIFDMLGKLVYDHQLVIENSSQQEFILSLNHLTPGMYFVDLKSEHFTTTAKLIRQDR